MPLCEVRIVKEPDNQYTWLYYKGERFQEVGGSNLTLAAAFNAGRDKIASEPNVGNAREVFIQADIP